MLYTQKAWIVDIFRRLSPTGLWNHLSSAASEPQLPITDLVNMKEEDLQPSRLLALPLELRQIVLQKIIGGNTVYVEFAQNPERHKLSFQLQKWKHPVARCPLRQFRHCNRMLGNPSESNKREFFDISILLVCRQLYQDSARFAGSDSFLFSNNTFAFRNQCGCVIQTLAQSPLNDDPLGFHGLSSFSMTLHSQDFSNDAIRLNRVMSGNLSNLRVKIILTDSLWEKLMDSYVYETENLRMDGLGSAFNPGINMFATALDCEMISGTFELNFVFTYRDDKEIWKPWASLAEKPNMTVTRSTREDFDDWKNIIDDVVIDSAEDYRRAISTQKWCLEKKIWSGMGLLSDWNPQTPVVQDTFDGLERTLRGEIM